jgi:hypothetical protein
VTDGCPDDALLSDLVAGAAPPPAAVELRAHLDECDACRETVAVLIRERRDSPGLARTAPAGPEGMPRRIGRFTVLGLLGKGGMGEVYRARDRQLGREVAIKVLPAALRSDPVWIARFEREARAIGQLSHPNLLALYDVGVHEGASYVVTELLDGTTLRARLGVPLPVARAVEIGADIAAGLAAAHDKGIVHRDVKPENIFLTRDGHVKILDFGLAKYQPIGDVGAAVEGLPTEPGAILGTVGYMAPEQVRGKPVDARSDIFSLGIVLYEMVAGQPPFAAGNDAEVMAAVLRDAPLPLPAAVPWTVARLIARCLEKDALERFQSARDLAVDLREALSGKEPARPRRRRRWPLVAAGAAALAAAALLAVRGLAPAPLEARVTYSRLTFRQGVVGNARLAPDERTVIYSASFGSEGSRVYATVPDGRESRALTEPGYTLAAVGRDGELAVLRGKTLARMSLSGAAPRDVADGVKEADFLATGELVVLRAGAIELPLDHPVYRSPGIAVSLRAARAGDRVAFVEHPIAGDGAGRVCTVTRAGAYACATDAHWNVMDHVAWAPDHDELWFSALEESSRGGIYAVAPSGPVRRLLGMPLPTSLLDIGRHGAVLRIDDMRMSARYRDPGGVERDLSWLDSSMVTGIAPDGSAILIAEGGMGSSSDYEAYLRPTDGGPAVHLGAGFPATLSDDKQWVVLFQRHDDRQRLVVMPTGSGAARELRPDAHPPYGYNSPHFFPGQTRIVYEARGPGGWQVLGQDIAGGDPVPLTGAGLRLTQAAVSPDGRTLLLRDAEGRTLLQPLAGGDARPLPQVRAGVDPLRFSSDGRALFLLAAADLRHARVTRLDLETGEETPVHDLDTDTDRVSVLPSLSADGKTVAYSVWKGERSLFVASGLSR